VNDQSNGDGNKVYHSPRTWESQGFGADHVCICKGENTGRNVGSRKLSQGSGNSRKSGTVREDTAYGALSPPSPRGNIGVNFVDDIT